MNITTIKTEKGDISHCKLAEDQLIGTASDFLEILVNCGTQTIVINKESLAEHFYDLKSGFAGDLLQKVSNYHKKIMIIGDFKDIESKSFKSFMYESNRSGTVLFVSNIESGVELLD